METLTQLSQFAQDILEGLKKTNKSINSKYLYDKIGDSIFQKIMEMPEYYLTRSEFEILTTKSKEIVGLLSKDKRDINLIELGAGDGIKTKILLEEMLKKGLNIEYFPIDISNNILQELQKSLLIEFPKLKVSPINMDYFKALKYINTKSNQRNIILFLGSNVGNFTYSGAAIILAQIAHFNKSGDLLLLGIDLKKDPRIIQNAYDDKDGISAEFNLNVLRRMNTELGANFNLNNFSYYTYYEPFSGEVRSFIHSKIKQKILLRNLDTTIEFEANEIVHTEISKKYSLKELEKLANESGFKVEKHYIDKASYFTDSLWKIV
ncbi:MAG: dimethylhistidine N-methyltransferase [Bacteroidetes bacterium CG2_30_33_31]|nr:MAG: dimethylhistidine N-methyltransferase [Bacteroidetes bacterium CG2_30_33_31]